MVLLGDAAHATTPFAGQGANQAVQDAYSLALKLEMLAAGRLPSLSAALGEYERIRKPVTRRIVAMSRYIGAMETASGPLMVLRDLMFSKSSVLIKALAEAVKLNV